MTAARKKLFFSSLMRKNIMILESFELDLWTEKAGNRRRNHTYVYEPHYCKTGTNGKRHRLIKKLNPVPTIFDPEESHLSTESKCLKSPVSVPRKSATKRVYQQDQFKLFEVQDKIKSLIILILRWHLRGMYFRNMRIMLFFTTLKLMCWTSQK